MQNKGKITVAKGQYRGSGEAIMFLRKNDSSICDKIIYLIDVEGEHELVADDFHMPQKVMLSCYQAIVPSLNLVWDIVES